ncbi:50S ribosomal protein L2 [Novimethylophilus kurashikiensis]|uniref:50S ribosomal protein L2 n=1 Tax=Novimethylophilus kurashikiensis TaxID=1825523 RepID=A0A2R5F8W3_9PROT|nr:50S ribosomal protein L2 [Novimethylophilus kurashikiensis]
MNIESQPKAHLFGPPAPHIAFWYGECYLGEVRGHPSKVDEARWRVQQTIEMLEPGPDGRAKVAMLCYGARTVLYPYGFARN